MRSPQVRYAIKSSLYIGVFFIVYLFATLNRVTGLLDPANPVFVLAALQSAFLPLQGLGTGGKRGSTAPMLAPPPSSAVARGMVKSGRTPSASQLTAVTVATASPPTRRASVSFCASVAQMGAVADGGGGGGDGDGPAAVPAAVREGSVFVMAAAGPAMTVGNGTQVAGQD
ncbi:hypothetical protein AMAG_09179 [Allomyces macrogynus ATCC 38327]|uniref:Uncharacterized protein n=1 Tax=Allomyces macrogynus (strain ATCC 38327) TaxID=578462 RepID=A0A0L0SNM6_ALLM3|nr:hypothetical protein AMAG_09179 [Allomyces macrogynus ATCC 38327]|eukprot:KNE64118.1 hypothetical protein AMAG_09179 [Allomyces macrogynus ATCC 38327]